MRPGAAALAWLRWRGYRLSEVLGPWRPSVRAWIGIAIALVAGLALNMQHLGPIQELGSTGTPWPRIALGVVLPLAAAAIWDRWRSAPVIIALHFAIDLLPSLRHVLGGTF